jgi:hypothetical protein
MYRMLRLCKELYVVMALLMGAFGLATLSACGGGGNSINPPTPPPHTPTPSLTIAIATKSPAIDVSQSDVLTATVSHDPGHKGVSWTVTCTSGVSPCGSMAQASSASGVADTYNAPSSVFLGEGFTVTATSLSNPAKSASIQLTVSAVPALASPAPTPPPPGNVGELFFLDLSKYIQGGSQPMIWSVKSGTLPPGLMLDAVNGTVQGTPTATSAAATRHVHRNVLGEKTTAMVFTVTDGGNPPMSVTVPVAITIDPPLDQIITVALATQAPAVDAAQSDLLTATVTHDTQNKGVNWTVTCSSGVSACGAMANGSSASGIADAYNAPHNISTAETLTVTATSVTDPSESSSVQIGVNPPPTLVSPTPSPRAGNVGQGFLLDLNQYVQGGTPTVVWSTKSGTLPAGLFLTTWGVVEGTPTATSTTNLVFTETDAGTPALSIDVHSSITIDPVLPLIIENPIPPDGTVGVVYGGPIHVVCPIYQHCHDQTGARLLASGGTPPIVLSWAPASGSTLPPGLDLEAYHYVRFLGGTPTTAGTYNVIVTATDSASPAVQTSASYAITIAP